MTWSQDQNYSCKTLLTLTFPPHSQFPFSLPLQVGAPSLHIPFVNPVNGQIRLTWNKSPHALRGTDEPRLLADVLLEELSVSVSERQYHSFLMEAKDCCEGRVSVGVRGEGEVCGGAREGEL